MTTAATIEQATHAFYLTVVLFSFLSLLSFSAAWHPVVAVDAESQCVVRSLAHFLPLIESLDSSDLN